MRREMADNRVLCEEQVGLTGAGHLTSLVFISLDPELNASIARYFKYIHHITVVTALLPITPNVVDLSLKNLILKSFTGSRGGFSKEPLAAGGIKSTVLPLTTHPSPLIIFNEMLIDGDICSIYPLWFAYGLRNHTQVYAFTLQPTDYSCNLINWEDFLKLSWQDHFSESIDFGKVPYFDNTRSRLTGVLKPHGGDSLYDLAAKFHMSFANASQYIARVKSQGNKVPSNFKPDVIDPGLARFRMFLEKERRHHIFLSMLPEAESLFSAVKELGSLLDELESAGIQGTGLLENLSRILSLIEAQTSFIHSFFLNLEPFLPGGIQ